MNRPPLLAHQREDVEWIRRHGRGLLGNEPGVGKSRSALTATQGASRVAIIAPNLVLASDTWDNQVNEWADNPDAYQQFAYSMLNDRESTVTKTGGKGSSPVKRLRPDLKGHWDALIVDEAHYTKGRKTHWTWAVEEIARNADMVLEMTGTPIPNWAHELYNPLRVIYPEKVVRGQGELSGFWKWAERWFDTSPTRFSNGNPAVGELLGCLMSSNKAACDARPPYDPCEHYIKFATENLGDRFRRVLRDDCLDLPPVTTSVVETPMTVAQRRVYREMVKNYVTTVNDQEVVAWNQGSKNVALDLITTSPWLLDRTGEPRGGKFERLRLDLESRARPTLVLGHYRHTVEGCASVARSIGAKSTYVHGDLTSKEAGKRVAAFRDGKLDVLCATIETIAEGSTLVVADMAIFVEMSFKNYRNTQARYRIDRLGQTRPVTVLEYLTPGTVDEKKRKRLGVKTDRQMRYLTAAQFKEML